MPDSHKGNYQDLSQTSRTWRRITWDVAVSIATLLGTVAFVSYTYGGFNEKILTLEKKVESLGGDKVDGIDKSLKDLNDPVTGTVTRIEKLVNGQVRPLVGEVRMWSGPYGKLKELEAQGWFWCDGGAINRATDKGETQFFKLVGVGYGVGDQTKSFNLPDFRNKSPMGATATASETNPSGRPFSDVEGRPAADGGIPEISLTSSQLPPHSHTGTTDVGSTAQLQQNAAGTNFHPKIYAGYSGQGGTELGGPAEPIGRVPGGEYLHRDWPGREHTHTFKIDDGPNRSPSPVNNVHPYFATWYLVYAGTDTDRVPPGNRK